MFSSKLKVIFDQHNASVDCLIGKALFIHMVADPVHFLPDPDPDPANQNFKNRICILSFFKAVKFSLIAQI